MKISCLTLLCSAVQANFGLSSKFSSINARITNFYLLADSATTVWSTNHLLNKPNQLFGPSYAYSDSGDSGWSVGGVLHKLVYVDTVFGVPIRGVTMLEEAMAFVTKTRSLPAGRTATALGFPLGRKVDLAGYDFRTTHSAEWLWALQRTDEFWRELLVTAFDITPNPLP